MSDTSKQTDIDHNFTTFAVCPYCGYEHRDCFEWSDSGNVECEKCDKTFWCDREVEVTYTTSKAEESES
jgi:hypothetical protein